MDLNYEGDYNGMPTLTLPGGGRTIRLANPAANASAVTPESAQQAGSKMPIADERRGQQTSGSEKRSDAMSAAARAESIETPEITVKEDRRATEATEATKKTKTIRRFKPMTLPNGEVIEAQPTGLHQFCSGADQYTEEVEVTDHGTDSEEEKAQDKSGKC